MLIVGLAAALVFGILVLAGGDWLPGTIIVVAALAGLAGQVQLLSKLRDVHAHGDGPVRR
ncbi:MAG TPA: hypothetical protein VLJ80_03140 [Solirubrobacteraceae bacterium]|nr:hypothetical protein [Solirubrobacteraceae bacterium]